MVDNGIVGAAEEWTVATTSRGDRRKRRVRERRLLVRLSMFGLISKAGSGCFFALKDGGGTKDDGIVLYHTYRDRSGEMVCR